MLSMPLKITAPHKPTTECPMPPNWHPCLSKCSNKKCNHPNPPILKLGLSQCSGKIKQQRCNGWIYIGVDKVKLIRAHLAERRDYEEEKVRKAAAATIILEKRRMQNIVDQDNKARAATEAAIRRGQRRGKFEVGDREPDRLERRGATRIPDGRPCSPTSPQIMRPSARNLHRDHMAVFPTFPIAAQPPPTYPLPPIPHPQKTGRDKPLPPPPRPALRDIPNTLPLKLKSVEARKRVDVPVMLYRRPQDMRVDVPVMLYRGPQDNFVPYI